MYKSVDNSKTFHFQLKSLKNAQYLGLVRQSPDKGQTGLKSQNLSVCELISRQTTHNRKKMKEASVKNISIFNPMVLVPPCDNCTDCGVHLPTPIFQYLHTIFYKTTQNLSHSYGICPRHFVCLWLAFYTKCS